MGKYKRLLSNTAILGAGTFVSKLLVFLLMPLYTALLSTEQFGTADILMQTANLLIPFASLGIMDALFRFALDAGEEKKKDIFTIALRLIIVGILPLSILAQLFRFGAIYDGYIWLIVFYVTSANLHLLCANYLRACNRTRVFAIQGIFNTLLTIVFNVLFLVVFKMGVLGYVLSVAISDLVVTFLIFVSCKFYREVRIKVSDKGLLREMLRFSIPYIPTAVMWMITSASDRFIVTAFSGAAENGLYAAAYKIPTLISLAGGVFIEAWQFSSVNDAKPEERARFFSTVYRNYMGIMFMGVSALILGSKLLTSLLLNDSYYDSWKYVPVLSIAMIFSSFSAFIGSVYFIEKKSMRSLTTAGAGALTNIVFNFLLIPNFGALGAAIATVISYVVAFLIRVVDTRKYMSFDQNIAKLLINTLIILAQTAILLLELPYWIVYEIALFAVVVIFNGREILSSVISIIKKLLGKKSKNI